uniref:Ig-like domain-containing protein n=1 Tax=Chelonoidis abingdonii TaxID=106734 RepID=A0A8C0J3F3_CHEAB
MAWAPLLLTLLTYCSGSLAQFVLTQPPSVSASPGQTVTISSKLSCAMSSGYSLSSYNLYWYQQRSGQAPRFVLSGTTSRGDRIPDRFPGSSSGNDGYLAITNIQAEGEADYYCAMWYGSGGVFSNFHGGDHA